MPKFTYAAFLMHMEAIFNFLETKSLKNTLIAGPPNFEKGQGPWRQCAICAMINTPLITPSRILLSYLRHVIHYPPPPFMK